MDAIEWMLETRVTALDALDIEELPTLEKSQFSNLKIDNGKVRVWRSRCSLRDGEREPLQLEFKINGKWIDIKDHPDYRHKMRNDDVCQSLRVPIAYKKHTMFIRYLLRNVRR